MAEVKSNPIIAFFKSKWVWIAAVVFGLILIFNLSYNKEAKIEYKNTITIQKDTVYYYRDQYNIEHAKVASLQTNLQTVELVYGAKIDSISKELSIKKNQIQSILEVNSQTTGTVKTGATYNQVDTSYDFNYNDKYLTLKGNVNKDSASIDYQMRESLQVVGYQKSTGFLGLGKKVAYVDIKSDNPNVHINDANSIKLDQIKDKKFSLGPSVGYYYNGTKWTPGIGISLQYSLIKF